MIPLFAHFKITPLILQRSLKRTKAVKNNWSASWQNQQNECVPIEDSHQPGHPLSLIRVFAVRMKKHWVLSYPLSAQRRLWSDWADASEDSDQTGRMPKLGIRPVWSVSSLSAWRNIGSLATHWAHSEDSDQTGRMPRLIWVFAGRTLILLVLSWGSSY